MQADFLTITSRDAELFGEAEAFLVGDIWHRTLFGANGRQDEEGLFVGRYLDGLFIASCAGARSHDLLRVLAMTQIDVSVARLDLQVTLAVPDADSVIRSVHPNPRYKSLLVAPVVENQKGATLYVGAPRSRKRLRVYNKSVQAGISPAVGEYLRVELQNRDTEADYYFGLFRIGGVQTAYKAFRGTVAVMAPEIGELLPEAGAAHIDVQLPKKGSNYSYWIEHSVIPGVQKAMLAGDKGVYEVLAKLKAVLEHI